MGVLNAARSAGLAGDEFCPFVLKRTPFWCPFSSPARVRRSVSIRALEALQVFHDVGQGEVFLLSLFGDSIDLFEGRNSANHFEHAVGVKG